MIRFIYRHIFTPKKQKIILTTLLLIAIWMVLFLDFTSTTIQRHYELSKDLMTYQSVIEQSFYVMLPLLVLMISNDHDQLFYHPLYAYFGKTKITMHQIITYILVVLMTFLVVFCYYGVILMVFFRYSVTHLLFFFLIIFIDHLMILMLILRCSGFKQKTMSYLIIIGIMVLNMIQLDQENLMIYYVLPIGNALISQYTHALSYKVLYLMMLIIIYISHQERRDLRHLA